MQRIVGKFATALYACLSIADVAQSSAQFSTQARSDLFQTPSQIPAREIRKVSVLTGDASAERTDIQIDYSDGTTHRLDTSARVQAIQLAPDGQTFGFNLVAYYVDTRGDLWISTKAIVLYSRGKRVAIIEPEKQATVGWAFRDGSSSIMVSAQGTHGPVYLALYDVATGKKKGEALEFDEGPKPKWVQGPPLLYCCTLKTTVTPYRR